MSTMARSAFVDAIRTIAADTARPHADAVDREGRFPREAMDALREAGTLAALVPAELGGPDVPLADVCSACFELARACASTGMVWAMHQIQLGCLVDHCAQQEFFRGYLAGLVERPALISSATSEVGVGGNLRRSLCALERDGDAVRVEKASSVLSYGNEADDCLLTCRRAPDADESDQVMVLGVGAQVHLEQTSTWDALGMRGTCSPAFAIRIECPAAQVAEASFAEVAPKGMVPYSHVLWSHVWLGVATEAYDRAAAFVRAQARPGHVPPTAVRLSELAAQLHAMRALVDVATAEFARLRADGGDEMTTFGYAIRINNLKIAASEAVARIAHDALQICGMAGYKNDSPFSVGRQVRDSLSAALMIGNERIHAADAQLLLVARSI